MALQLTILAHHTEQQFTPISV